MNLLNKITTWYKKFCSNYKYQKCRRKFNQLSKDSQEFIANIGRDPETLRQQGLFEVRTKNPPKPNSQKSS